MNCTEYSQQAAQSVIHRSVRRSRHKLPLTKDQREWRATLTSTEMSRMRSIATRCLAS